MLLKLPNEELPVAVDHSQLRTMTSEMVGPIWLAVTPHSTQFSTTEIHVLHEANADYKSQDVL